MKYIAAILIAIVIATGLYAGYSIQAMIESYTAYTTQQKGKP